jgi:hypothetical protein
MYVLASSRHDTGVTQYRFAEGLQGVFDIGLALIHRGDDLVRIIGTKDVIEIDPSHVRIASAKRAWYATQGVKYEPPLALTD